MKATVPANDRELRALLKLSIAIKRRAPVANSDCPKIGQSRQGITETSKTRVRCKTELGVEEQKT